MEQSPEFPEQPREAFPESDLRPPQEQLFSIHYIEPNSAPNYEAIPAPPPPPHTPSPSYPLILPQTYQPERRQADAPSAWATHRDANPLKTRRDTGR